MRLIDWLEKRFARLDVSILLEANVRWCCTISGYPFPARDRSATFILARNNDQPRTIQGFGSTPNRAYANAVRMLAKGRFRLAVIDHRRSRDENFPFPKGLTA